MSTRTKRRPTGGIGSNQYGTKGASVTAIADARRRANRFRSIEAPAPITVQSGARPPIITKPDNTVDHAAAADWLNAWDGSSARKPWAPYGRRWGRDITHMAVIAERPIPNPRAAIDYLAEGALYMDESGWDPAAPGIAVDPDENGNARVWVYNFKPSGSGRDNRKLREAMAQIPDTLRNGSPVRTTERRGADAYASRAVEGVGPCAVAFR